MATRKKKSAPAEKSFPAEDYESIEAAVMETARGRWFLKEYARRNRVIEATTIETSLNQLAERLETFISQHSTGDGVLEQLTMMRTQLSENAPRAESPEREPDIVGADVDADAAESNADKSDLPVDDVALSSESKAGATLENADVFATEDDFDSEAFLFAEAAQTDTAALVAPENEPTEDAATEQEPIASADVDAEAAASELEFTGEDPLYVDAAAQPDTEIEDGAFIIDDLDFSGKASEQQPPAQTADESAGDVFDESQADAEFEALDLPTAEPSENDILPEPADQTVILSKADKTSDDADVFATNVQILPGPGEENYPLTKHAVGAGGRIDAIAEGQIDVELDEELLEELSEADKSALFS